MEGCVQHQCGPVGLLPVTARTSSRELVEAKNEVSRLASAKSEELGSLRSANEELESKFNKLNFDFNSLDRLYKMLAKVDAERLADIEGGKTWNEELEGISKGEIRNEIRNKDPQLYDAKKQVEELKKKLLSASSQLPQSPPSAPESSPPPKVSPASTPSPPPTVFTSPAEDSRSWLRLRRLPAAFSSCSLSSTFPFLFSTFIP